MPTDPARVVAEATERYWNDVEFHARVERAVLLAIEEVKHRTNGGIVQRQQRSDMALAVAIGLVLEPSDWRCEECQRPWRPTVSGQCRTCGNRTRQPDPTEHVGGG